MVTLNQEFELDHPSDDVLEWCRQLVRAIADGGVWGIPRSGTIFRIDQAKKQLVLICCGEDDSDFLATRRVFKHIGWDVTREEYDTRK
jgi:hypothetical protein